MAIVSAIVVIVADEAKPEYVWLSIVPIILFYFLDSYYLGLERGFRDRYNEFVRKLHEERASRRMCSSCVRQRARSPWQKRSCSNTLATRCRQLR